MDANILRLPERRRHSRTQLRVTLRGLRLDPGGELVDLFHMLDISRGGLGAIVDRPYYRGQRVVLNLPALEDGSRRSVYASVVRCRGDSEGYHVGLRFEPNTVAISADHRVAAMAA